MEVPPLLWVHHSFQASMRSLTGKEGFWTFSFWVFTEASLLRHNWLKHCHWLLIQPPALVPYLEDWGWDWKFQPSKHLVGSPGNQPPHWVWSQSHLINKTKDTLITVLIGNSKRFVNSELWTADKNQIYMRNISWSSEWPNIYFV